MIRCTIELLPGGDEARARTIGIVEIANVAVLPGNIGEYVVALKKTPPFSGALRAAWRKGRLVEGDQTIVGGEPSDDDDLIVTRIGGHHRTRRGVYDLLYRALRACGLEQRNPNETAQAALGMRPPPSEPTKIIKTFTDAATVRWAK